MRSERGWWLIVGVWLLVLVFWRPEPPPLYTQVPSVTPEPHGFRIFYDLIEKEVSSVSRTLRGAAHLTNEDVLVLLRPSEGLSDDERHDIMDWVSERGGTLVVAYPIWDDNGKMLRNVFPENESWTISKWKDAEASLKEIEYLHVNSENPREVESFTLKTQGHLELGEGASEVLASADDGTVLATLETFGTGAVVQIADSVMLNNQSIGFKKTHLFAAALIDEVGRTGTWVFDESHEGVSVQPALAPLIGTGPFRAVFLHLLLILIFWYWYMSRRLVRIERAPDERRVREVTTLAADIGSFYFRAKKGGWALSRYAQYFRRQLQGFHAGSTKLADAEQLVRRADEMVAQGGEIEEQLQMVKTLAERRKVLEEQRDK
ncbi:MAG: DUF4350 domain-containing protein [Deltaproteobacteria bacterium]|nr:DUF4350 domain-containing protein [Deltaproteobacteria bacterium]MBN2671626.1 DUF4350 domain-containing protein [Deltaproteobacteria bacterium]